MGAECARGCFWGWCSSQLLGLVLEQEQPATEGRGDGGDTGGQASRVIVNFVQPGSLAASEEVGARSEGIAERTIAEPKGARGGSRGSGLGGGKEGGAQVMLPSGSKSKPLCR